MLLGQTLAQRQQEVEENPGNFTHATSCRGREGAFVTTKAQSWSANLSCSKQQCCQSCSFTPAPVQELNSRAKTEAAQFACKRKGVCRHKAAELQEWHQHWLGNQHTLSGAHWRAWHRSVLSALNMKYGQC